MKKLAILSVLFFLAAVILQPTLSCSKFDGSKSFVAEGSPLPWPIPLHGTLVADGEPLPPPIPKPTASISKALVADGEPLPPPIPKPTASISKTLVADGEPLPPPIPKPLATSYTV